MKEIGTAMAGPSLSLADGEKVKALRAEGVKLHKSVNHSASVEALSEAKDMPGI